MPCIIQRQQGHAFLCPVLSVIRPLPFQPMPPQSAFRINGQFGIRDAHWKLECPSTETVYLGRALEDPEAWSNCTCSDRCWKCSSITVRHVQSRTALLEGANISLMTMHAWLERIAMLKLLLVACMSMQLAGCSCRLCPSPNGLYPCPLMCLVYYSSLHKIGGRMHFS